MAKPLRETAKYRGFYEALHNLKFVATSRDLTKVGRDGSQNGLDDTENCFCFLPSCENLG
ncbi:hypothetical protein JCM11017A_06890 [Bacteroides fragilis]